MSFASPQADADINKTVKVLGILIDFPDLLHDNNRLSASDTAMYYPSYPTSHYNNLMFSPTGFTGPQGQNSSITGLTSHFDNLVAALLARHDTHNIIKQSPVVVSLLRVMLKVGIPRAKMRPITALMIPIMMTVIRRFQN